MEVNKSSEKSIKVFSPATVSNVGCGFDIMGFALRGIGEELVVTMSEKKGLRITNIHGFDHIPLEPNKNSATVAVQAMLDEWPENEYGFEFEIFKNIYPGSGLGTSASSSAGAVFAVNELLNRPFSELELIGFAMEGEKLISGKAHADNVAPTVLGGLVVVRSYAPLDIITIPHPEQLWVAVIHPQVEIKTAEARKILPDKVPLPKTVAQCGNVAGLLSGLYTGDLTLIGRSMQDAIAEPVRSRLIPFYEEAHRIAMDNGAISFNISGSGPSMFAFLDNKEKADLICNEIQHLYGDEKIEAAIYSTQIAHDGVSII